MAYISKITLPSGNTYNIKDETARASIAALNSGSFFLGITTTELYDLATTNPVTIDGSSVTAVNGNIVVYDKAEFIYYKPDSNATGKWIEFGDLSNLGTLAYKHAVTLSKGSGDVVLGEGTTFTASAPTVTIGAGSTDTVLGTGTTFTATAPTVTVTPTTTCVKAAASGTEVGPNGTASVIAALNPDPVAAITDLNVPLISEKLDTTKIWSVGGTTSASYVSGKTVKYLETTTIPNVTSVGNADTWSFTMNGETLVIGGTNGTVPTLGNAITAATGSTVASADGDAVITTFAVTQKNVATAGTVTTVATGTTSDGGMGGAVGVAIGSILKQTEDCAHAANLNPTMATVLTGVKVTAQPTVALSTSATSGAGCVQVATGATATATAPTVTASGDNVTALTAVGSATATSPTITVGTNDKVTVAKYADLSVSVS